MHFSQAFIAALSLSAVSAMPVKHASRSHDVSNFNKLAIRGAPAEILMANMPVGRAPAPEMIAAAQQIQALAARQSSGTASISSVMQVLSCLLDVLLGRGTSCLEQFTNSTGNSTNATAAARKQLVGMLTDLSGFINSTSSDLQKSDKKSAVKKNSARDLLVRESTSINEVLAMLNNLGQMVQKLMTDLTALGLRQQEDAEDGADDDESTAPSTDFPVTPTETADGKETGTKTSQPEKTSVPTDTADDKETGTSTKTADSGKTTASTDDTKTLLPTTSKSAPTSEKTFGVNCPNPIPNDGMYRPGCPGYGRRDVRPSRRHVRRDASQDQLKQVLPALATIIEAMPGLLSAAGSNGTAASNSTDVEGKNATSAVASNVTNLADSSAYKKVVKQLQTAIGELNGNATSTATASNSTSVGDDKVPSSNTTATDKGESKTDKDASASSAAAAAVAQSQSEKENTNSRQAVSAANISHGSRDLSHLLNADGFEFVRRSTGNSDASQDNQGGINVSLLNNLLNGLLSARDTGDSDASQANQGGINVDLLNNLLNGVLSSRSTGSSDASQANQGGINVDLLNNLLNGLLSSRDLQERAASQKVDLQAVNNLFAQVLGGKGLGKAN